MASKSSKTLTDHDKIQRWAEARDATPACVRGTGGAGDPGMIRLDFPGYSGSDKLQEISWDDWFEAFDDNDLALVVQEKTAGGRRSNFNKLVARETAPARGRKDRSSAGSRGKKRPSGTARSRSRSTSGSGRSTRRGSGTTGSRRSSPRGRGTGGRAVRRPRASRSARE